MVGAAFSLGSRKLRPEYLAELVLNHGPVRPSWTILSHVHGGRSYSRCWNLLGVGPMNGAISLIPTDSADGVEPWALTDPWGVAIPVGATQTMGVQEALNIWGDTKGKYGSHLEIAGCCAQNSESADYATLHLQTTVTIPPTIGGYIRCSGSVIWEFDQTDATDGLVIESQEDLFLDLQHIVNYSGQGTAVRFAPSIGVPFDNIAAIWQCDIRLGEVYASNAAATGLMFDIGKASILNNRIVVRVIDGTGSRGLVVSNGNGTSVFQQNLLDLGWIEAWSKGQVWIGNSSRMNDWRMSGVSLSSGSGPGIDTHGNGDNFNVALDNNNGGTGRGLIFRANSANNTYLIRGGAKSWVQDLSGGKNKNLGL